MTCIEKMKIECPNLVDSVFSGGAFGCPHDYGYLPKPYYCVKSGFESCKKCWNREISDTEVKDKPGTCDVCTHHEVCKYEADFKKCLNVVEETEVPFFIGCKRYSRKTD